MELAVLVHTFLRDEKMVKCINSILQKIPYAKIYLSDGGVQTKDKESYYKVLKHYGHEVLLMPFDIGTAVSRNILLEKITEKYVMKIDDDFVITNKTKIDEMIELLDNVKDIHLLGMAVASEKRKSPYIFNIHKRKRGELFDYELRHFDWQLKRFKDLTYVYCDVTPDCFIARRSIFPECNWDEQYHIGEGQHTDFFFQLKYMFNKKVAYTDDSLMKHLKHDPNDEDSIVYKKLRVRKAANNIKLRKKWDINNINYW